MVYLENYECHMLSGGKVAGAEAGAGKVYKDVMKLDQKTSRNWKHGGWSWTG
jgi:hypothetical protein